MTIVERIVNGQVVFDVRVSKRSKRDGEEVRVRRKANGIKDRKEAEKIEKHLLVEAGR